MSMRNCIEIKPGQWFDPDEVTGVQDNSDEGRSCCHVYMNGGSIMVIPMSGYDLFCLVAEIVQASKEELKIYNDPVVKEAT